MRKEILATAVIVCIVAIATGWYMNRSKAEFEVSSLEISPSEVFIGETATISVDVRNVGTAEGTYIATLTVNGVQVETKKVSLSEGEVKTLTFTVLKDTCGNYTIKVEELEAILIVKEKKLFVGAYVEYKVKGIYGAIFSGIIKSEVVEVTEETCTLRIKYEGVPLDLPIEFEILKLGTHTYRFDESILPSFSTGISSVKEESGKIHYSYTGGGQILNVYVDKATNLILELHKTSDCIINLEISNTNIEWLKG